MHAFTNNLQQHQTAGSSQQPSATSQHIAWDFVHHKSTILIVDGHAEASRRIDMMIAKRDQRYKQYPKFSEFDAVEDEMGRNAADGQRLLERMMTACRGFKR